MAMIKKVSVKKPKEVKFKLTILIKPLIILFLTALLYIIYNNWQTLLEKLDDKPISAFALIGTPQYTTNEDIRDAITKMGSLKGFWGQDVDEVREQIQDSMPWLKGSVVRKIWPNRLSVMVAEYQPIAYWNDDAFLSSDGVIFHLPKEKLKESHLPRLSGPDYQSENVLATWNQISKVLQVKGMTLYYVAIDERGSWDIQVNNGILLKLGRGDWKAKLDRFMTIYPQIEVPENKKIDYVDLRYQSGAAVSFRDVN
ncbi:MAG: cell division protein FtsQ/DivIB [Pasteurellaceae bacterium]|nr:cell division protein FtsQ/DivIB [Pasteurellaceae bacterium]